MAVVTLVSCTDRDDTEVVSFAPVDVSLAFSIPDIYEGSDVTTRMADSVVQISYSHYRGLKDVRVIPFTTTGIVTKAEEPFIFDATDGNESGRIAGKPSELTPDAAFYYYPECSFWPGTASVLFYAKGANTVMVNGTAIPASDKTYYGSTLMTGSDNRTPSNIQFSLEQIRPEASVDTKAQALADYLTTIANTAGWATTGDVKMARGKLANRYFMESSLALQPISEPLSRNYMMRWGSGSRTMTWPKLSVPTSRRVRQSMIRDLRR